MRLKVFSILVFILALCLTELSAQSTTTSPQAAETPFINDPKLQVKNTIELFPNPVEDYLHVKIVNSELSDVKFEMHSIIGNVIDIETEQIGSDDFRIPVETFASGYYFLVVKDDGTRFSKAFKFLKKN